MRSVIFVGLLLVTTPALAQDGFTRQDRELLVELRVRLEEMDKRFEQVDKRFEEFQAGIDTRFEQVDKRFEQVDKRLAESQASLDKRLAESQASLDKRLAESQASLDKRFEQVANQIAVLRQDMNERFEQMSGFLYILAGIFTSMVVAVIGFAYWDRRTIIREARREAIEFMEKEGVLRRLLDAFRTLAEDDPRLASALKRFNLL